MSQRLFSTGSRIGRTNDRRKRSGVDVDMTSMIDVVFLLLIFFMVSSTMQSTPELDLPVAKYTVGVETDGAAVITLLDQGVGVPPQILLGDGRGEEASLEEIPDYVAASINAGRRKIIIKAEGEITHGTVQAVTRLVTGVEGAQLYLGVGETETP